MKYLENASTITVEMILESGEVLTGTATFDQKHCSYKLVAPVEKSLECTQLMYGIPLIYFDPETDTGHSTSVQIVDVRNELKKAMLHYWENREEIESIENLKEQFWKNFAEREAVSLADRYKWQYRMLRHDRESLKLMLGRMKEMATQNNIDCDLWFRTDGKAMNRDYQNQMKQFREKQLEVRMSVHTAVKNLIPIEFGTTNKSCEKAEAIIRSLVNQKLGEASNMLEILFHINCNPKTDPYHGSVMYQFLMEISPKVNSAVRVTDWAIHKNCGGIVMDGELEQFKRMIGISRSHFETAVIPLDIPRIKMIRERYSHLKSVRFFEPILDLILNSGEESVQLIVRIDPPLEKFIPPQPIRVKLMI